MEKKMNIRQKKEAIRYLSPKSEVGPCFSGSGDFRILFLNTNPYHVGVVNLGWQTVVEYLLVACPFVSVRLEYEDTIRDAHLKLSDFNLILVHIPFETNYPIAISMLNQIGLPVLSRERSKPFPIVVAGGLYNPLPLVDFIDIFVLGDGRIPIAKVVNLCFGEGKEANKKKMMELIIEKKIKGIFIPTMNEGEEKIFASYELSLNEYPIHTIWSAKDNIYGLPPDYLSIMVALGCRYKCSFCLISHCQGIGRERETEIDTDRVLEILNWRRQFIPVKTVKLFFASSANQGKIKEILSELIKEKVEVLVGSLNCEQIDDDLVILLKQSGRNNIIVAPETNQNQRWKINKGYITDERISEIVKLANKYRLPVSLYLMYGLPGETDRDIIELGKLVKKTRQALDKGLEIQVHCNQVYLKPHTPWQYARQILPEENIHKFSLFKEQLVNTEIEIKTLDLYSSVLQSLLARGDKQMTDLLMNIAFYPPNSVKELIKRTQRIIPNWRDYFRERDMLELPWHQIVFQDHKILWHRWLSFNQKLKEGVQI